MTLEQWLKIWLETYLTDVKKSTVAQYEYQIRVHIVPGIPVQYVKRKQYKRNGKMSLVGNRKLKESLVKQEGITWA